MQSTSPATSADDPHAVLASLGSRLDDLIERAGPGAWTTDTPASGWDVRTQVAHLAWTDEVSLAAITDPDAFAGVMESAMADPTGFVDTAAAEVAAGDRDEVLSRWRTARAALGRALSEVDPGEQIPWFGPPMRPKSMATARIMETWAHGTDVADALGCRLVADDALGLSWLLMTRTWLTTSAICPASRMPSRPKAGIRLVRVASWSGFRIPWAIVYSIVEGSPPHSQSSSVRLG